jgi:hypothetical protein
VDTILKKVDTILKKVDVINFSFIKDDLPRKIIKIGDTRCARLRRRRIIKYLYLT